MTYALSNLFIQSTWRNPTQPISFSLPPPLPHPPPNNFIIQYFFNTIECIWWVIFGPAKFLKQQCSIHNMPWKPEAYFSLGSSKRTIIVQAKRQLNILACGEGTQLLADILNSKWGSSIKQVYFFFFFISSVNNTACFPPLLFLAPFPQKTQLFLFVSLCNSIENHKTY